VSTVALRTSLIWHDEVMDDVVVERPRKITLGRSGKTTFTVPDIGLPKNFAIVRPGNRGYLLTLGENMRGTICIDGRERDVSEFVNSGEGQTAGGFCATPISGKDWGVIDLDESGHYKLFFQFVPVTEAPQFFTPAVILAGLIGYMIAGGALTFMWWSKGFDIDECAFRGGGMATIVLAVAALGYYIYLLDPESQASLAFSVILHGALLGWLVATYHDENPFVWPGPRALTGNYLITRLEPEPPQEQPKRELTVGKAQKQDAAAVSPTKPNLKTATKGAEGKSGGKGDVERARSPNANDDDKPAAPKVALLDDNNVKYLDNIANRDLETPVGKFQGIKGELRRGDVGYGKGSGSGVGSGQNGVGATRGSKKGGRGGGGNSEGEFEAGKAVDTGPDRPGGDCKGAGCTGAAPKEIKLAINGGSGDFGGYTEDEIYRVVRGAQGQFKACYQKELNRTPGLGGKLVIKWKINADGKVETAANNGNSTLVNAEVESCVKRNVLKLKFPPKGRVANVVFPFAYTQGG
jgi:hypothetical protein